MAYTAPTAAEIKTRFVEFSAVDNSLIDAAIAEAKLFVDTLWPEAAYKMALMYRTAHQLKVDGYGQGASVQGMSLTGVTSFSIDDLSISRGKAADLELEIGEMSTKYGRHYLQLRAKYFGGGALTG